MGAGGVIPPPEGYFAAIQPVLERYGIPLVADEVICGLGGQGGFGGARPTRSSPTSSSPPSA